MIVFDLQCINGHTFEGWFEHTQAFEAQQKQGIIICPFCDTTSITQKLSPVSIKTSSSYVSQTTKDIEKQRETASKDAIIELGTKIKNFFEKNFKDVDSDFTKQALKMHYGVSKPKNIRGTTTKEDDKVLAKEGIFPVKIPFPIKSDKDDLN
ncbi:MAG: hypothetical protein B6I26_05600 [Desulfobacteraceae bacterium 4572_130]|nr:MAG: hypothetical protein B6I26_05600 [Desulfobacteraceae bacterium 4572_130]